MRKVILIGDSIRMGYEPFVREALGHDRPPASPAPSPPFSRPERQVGRLRRSRTVLIEALDTGTSGAAEAWGPAENGGTSENVLAHLDEAAYNRAALDAAHALGVEVDDLFEFVTAKGRDGLLADDGVHFTRAGYQLLGEEVARVVRAALGA